MALAYLDPGGTDGGLPLDLPGRPSGGPGIPPHPVKDADGLPPGSGALLPEPPRPRREVDLLTIAEGFAVSAPAIPELQAITERSWVLLAVTDLFEAWAIGWPRGGRIELHDHGHSCGAVVVASGALSETAVHSAGHDLAVITTRRIAAGEHRRFGPHYVHGLLNDGGGPAVSVHVYGPRLSAMSYYELSPTGRLGRLRTEAVPRVGPFDVTSDHDPS
jgi:hypothetical protein